VVNYVDPGEPHDLFQVYLEDFSVEHVEGSSRGLYHDGGGLIHVMDVLLRGCICQTVGKKSEVRNNGRLAPVRFRHLQVSLDAEKTNMESHQQ
jgi:hypothetical protein